MEPSACHVFETRWGGPRILAEQMDIRKLPEVGDVGGKKHDIDRLFKK